ncbi:MAG: hypothetical protein QOF89_4480 [Acidobacteriota bacterium]|nr:hypothetical protein [Acidobacteriota bacterium]
MEDRINYSLVHAGLRQVIRSLKVPPGALTRVRLSADFSQEIVLPGGVYRDLSPPLVASMFAQLESPLRGAQLILERDDGETRAEPVVLAPLNAWDLDRSNAAATAVFVLEHDRVIAELVRTAGVEPAPAGPGLPACQVAERLFDALKPCLGPRYLFDRKVFPPSEQAVRLPFQMAYDLGGTCIDFVLLYAAALLRAGLRPLVLILGEEEGMRHAIAAFQTPTAASTGMPVQRPADLLAAWQRGEWTAVEVTWTAVDKPWSEAVAAAGREIERGPLLWGIDVAAAREAEIDSLPGRACETTFVGWEARITDQRTQTLTAHAAEILDGVALEVVASRNPADHGHCWDSLPFRVRIGRWPGNDVGLHELTVSQAHALLYGEGSEIRLVDLASKGGTVLAGCHLEPFRSYSLSPGQTFDVAGVKLRLMPKSSGFPEVRP